MPPVAAKNILLTGLPGCGKTTLVRRVAELMKDRRLAGFYTQEVRQQGQRVGFEAIGFGGRRAMLAHVDFHTQHRVGRYGVDVKPFEAIVEAELNGPSSDVNLFVIDEIGRMECLSPVFVEVVSKILDGPVPVLATVATKGGGFIAKVKGRPDVEIIVVTAANRDLLPELLSSRLSHAIKEP